MQNKNDIKREIEDEVNWFLTDMAYDYNASYNKIMTEAEYCDAIVNEVQKQLLAWVSVQQHKYGG